MKEKQTFWLIGLFCTPRLHQNKFVYTERNNVVDKVFAWLLMLLAMWCWIWVPHSGRLSLHLPDPSMPSSSGKHSVPLALFPRAEFFPQDWSPFLKFPLVWKWFEGFLFYCNVWKPIVMWCLDPSYSTLKLVAQIPWQWKLHRIYVKRDLTRRSKPLIGGTLGGIEHLPLNKKR